MKRTNDQGDGGSLPRAVTALYRAVLSYLITMVCLHFGTIDLGLQSNVIRPGARSHRASLEAVKAAESALPLFNGARVKVRLERVLDTAKQTLEPEASPSGPGKDDQEDPPASVPSGGARQEELLKKLHVTDPRLSVPKVQMGDCRDPTHELYHALLLTPQYSEFRDWSRNDDGNRLLCVSGDPGQGKTMLLTGVVQTQLAGRAHTKGYDPRQLSFFFVDSGRPDADHPAAALRSLIWLLLDTQPELGRHLEDQLTSTARDSFSHPSDFLALSAVFYRMMADDALKETYFVVDALDECSPDPAGAERPGLDDFLLLIAKTLSMTKKVRWLVSGDDIGAIGQVLLGEGMEVNYLHLDLRCDLRASPTALTMYIDSKVEELGNAKGYDGELRRQVADRLHEQSRGNYLWVSIACSALRAEEVWYALDVLEDAQEHGTVQQLYEHMYDNIKRLPRKDGAFCIRAISTMALVTGPLRIEELNALVGLDERVQLSSILRKCSAFLREVDGVVAFLHPSAKKYIQVHTLTPFAISETHSTLTRNCLDHLGATLGTSGSGHRKATTSYSVLNWIPHLSLIADPSHHTHVAEKVHWFYENHFLAWIEHLVLHDQLSAAAAKLQQADLRLQRAVSPTVATSDLHAAVREGLLFIRLHLSSQSPRGVPGHNTLLFCPDDSRIRRLWTDKALPWLASAPPPSRHWHRDFRSFRGHRDWIRSVAFSANGRLLASGSDDSTVRIWDVETGEMQHVLEVERGWVYSVALSAVPVGPSRIRVVAAGSDDSSVTLWDLDTGRQVKMLKDHPGCVNSVAFSSDSARLAVASSSIVRVWDMEALGGKAGLKETTGASLDYRDIPHDNTVRSVAFSPGGQLLITACDDAKVRVWDMQRTWKDAGLGPSEENQAQAERKQEDAQDAANTSQEAQTDEQHNIPSNSDADGVAKEPKRSPTPLQILEGHRDAINSVAYSARSQLIASGSDDGTSRVWRRGSEKFEAFYTLDGSRSPNPVKSVAFFEDGASSYLASSINDSIDVWEMKAGQRVQTARSQSPGRIFSMAFAPNGAYLATGDRSTRVVLWCTMPWEDADHDSSEEQPHIMPDVDEMALSPDRRTLAISYAGGDVSLWDVTTGKLLTRAMDLKHTRSLCSLLFSPEDGTMLATASADGTLGICEVPSGARLNKFAGHLDWVRCAAWSPDAQYVASGSDDGTVRIWKIRGSDDQEPAVLRHDDDSYVYDVGFSPNGKSLVTCGTGGPGRVRIWEQRVQDGTENSDESGGWELKRTAEGPEGLVYRVAVSLDSKRVVSLASQDALGVWDLETGKPSKGYPATHFRDTDRWVRIWFDARSEDHVVSAYGAQSLTGGDSSSSPFSRAPRWCPYRIVYDSASSGWHVARDGKKLMFLPRELVGITNLLLAGENWNSLVCGLRDGKILIFRFAREMVSRADYVHDVVAV
jgi:WD40 repeat protein